MKVTKQKERIVNQSKTQQIFKSQNEYYHYVLFVLLRNGDLSKCKEQVDI